MRRELGTLGLRARYSSYGIHLFRLVETHTWQAFARTIWSVTGLVLGLSGPKLRGSFTAAAYMAMVYIYRLLFFVQPWHLLAAFKKHVESEPKSSLAWLFAKPCPGFPQFRRTWNICCSFSRISSTCLPLYLSSFDLIKPQRLPWKPLQNVQIIRSIVFPQALTIWTIHGYVATVVYCNIWHALLAYALPGSFQLPRKISTKTAMQEISAIGYTH